MKRNLALTLVLVFFCSLLQAQMPKFISITGDWLKGDVMTYSVEKTKKDNGKKGTARYTLVLEVVDSTETNYRIKATYKGKVIDDENIVADTLQKLIKSINADLENVEQTVYYLTDNVGSFVEIENWQEVLEESIQQAGKLLKQISVDEEAYQKSIDLVRNMYGKEQVAGKLCMEIPLLHQYIGYIVQTKPKKFTTQFGTQFGPIEGKGLLKVTDYNPETEYCRLESTTSINQKQMMKAIAEFFKMVGSLGGNTLTKKELNSVKLDMTDTEVWEYQASPAIPLRMEYARTIHASAPDGDSLQEERYVIKKID
ncbi:MAG: hypothetical protein K6A41_02250 [Bacteroidales bacterium]|nr:hypothetical protein [Bacteroidales bacterium]